MGTATKSQKNIQAKKAKVYTISTI